MGSREAYLSVFLYNLPMFVHDVFFCCCLEEPHFHYASVRMDACFSALLCHCYTRSVGHLALCPNVYASVFVFVQHNKTRIYLPQVIAVGLLNIPIPCSPLSPTHHLLIGQVNRRTDGKDGQRQRQRQTQVTRI